MSKAISETSKFHRKIIINLQLKQRWKALKCIRFQNLQFITTQISVKNSRKHFHKITSQHWEKEH